MLKTFTDTERIQKQWRKIKLPIFLNINFLQIYCKMHPKINHLFIIDTSIRLYAHVFKLTFNKVRNYLPDNSISNILLKLINLNVLYLTNSFITNIPAFTSKKVINLNQLLNTIKQNYSVIVIPDFLFKNMKVEDDNYTKIKIEEEMVLNIRGNWNRLEDYLSDLRKKYRRKIINIMERTNALEIKRLDANDLEYYAINIQHLFIQVVKSSRFRGPQFNTNSFALFVKQGFMTVDGYFLSGKLVGFSSTMQNKEKLYSYFVGFDKSLNKSLPIYGRILIENINSAIKLKKNSLILGRTANEYKSNFGAFPVKSYIYLKVQNKLINIMLKPIYNRLRIKKWKQRSPFKTPSLN